MDLGPTIREMERKLELIQTYRSATLQTATEVKEAIDKNYHEAVQKLHPEDTHLITLTERCQALKDQADAECSRIMEEYDTRERFFKEEMERIMRAQDYSSHCFRLSFSFGNDFQNSSISTGTIVNSNYYDHKTYRVQSQDLWIDDSCVGSHDVDLVYREAILQLGSPVIVPKKGKNGEVFIFVCEDIGSTRKFKDLHILNRTIEGPGSSTIHHKKYPLLDSLQIIANDVLSMTPGENDDVWVLEKNVCKLVHETKYHVTYFRDNNTIKKTAVPYTLSLEAITMCHSNNSIYVLHKETKTLTEDEKKTHLIYKEDLSTNHKWLIPIDNNGPADALDTTQPTSILYIEGHDEIIIFIEKTLSINAFSATTGIWKTGFTTRLTDKTLDKSGLFPNERPHLFYSPETNELIMYFLKMMVDRWSYPFL